MTSPKVSVIIPTFNGAQWIADTIESVVDQTFKDFEIIVVNDGSTDDTEEILKPYLHKIIYIHQDNKGPAVARNTGIRNSKGDYIGFLDDDDIWESEKLALQVSLLENQKDIGVVFSNYTPFGLPVNYKKGFDRRPVLSRIPRQEIGPNTYKISKDSIFVDLLQDLFVFTSTMLVRRDCFDKIGLLDEKLIYPAGEDWQICLRLSKHFTFSYMEDCLVKRRERAGSCGRQGRDDFVAIKILEDIHNWVSLSKLEQYTVTEKLLELSFSAGYVEYSNYHLPEARYYLQKSIKNCMILLRNLKYSKHFKIILLYYALTYVPKQYLKKIRSIKHRLKK